MHRRQSLGWVFVFTHEVQGALPESTGASPFLSLLSFSSCFSRSFFLPFFPSSLSVAEGCSCWLWVESLDCASWGFWCHCAMQTGTDWLSKSAVHRLVKLAFCKGLTGFARLWLLIFFAA